MKNQWIHYFSGYLRVKVTGIRIEQFLNQCVRENIEIWNIKRVNDSTMTFFIKLADLGKMRYVVKRSDCKLSFIGKRGLPFIKKQILLNTGFLFGMLSFIIIIFIFSNMVWNIEVEGADPKTEHDLRKVLDEMDIEPGKFHFFLPEVEKIQQAITAKMESIMWVGVDVQGTTYHFRVVEKEIPEEAEYLSPRHLIATKKAIIHDLFVEKGQPLVKVNDFVNKGDILVSGIIGKEENTKIVAAQGDVYGEVWYKSTVKVPLKTDFLVYTGENEEKHVIHIFGLEVPVWGFGDPQFESFETSNNLHPIKFLDWPLPITYEHIVYRENEKVTRQYSEQTAIAIGKTMGKKGLLEKLEDDAEIKGQKILQQKAENGKVKLTIQFQVIENIAKGQPIIQGD